MKKLLSIIFALITLGSFVPMALGVTKQFEYNTLSGGTLTTSLVSYWNMEGNSNDYYGSTNGSDTSVTYSSSYGKVNEGGDYNGSSSNTTWAVSNSNYFSLNFWAYTASVASYMSLITKNYSDSSWSSPYRQYAVWLNGNGGVVGEVTIGGSPNTVTSANSVISAGWNMFTLTYDGTTIRLYANGSQVQSAAISGTNNAYSTKLSAGKIQTLSDYMTGYLDEIGLWSKALDTQEITDLYHSGAGQTMCTVGVDCPSSSSPVHSNLFNWIFSMKAEHFTFA